MSGIAPPDLLQQFLRSGGKLYAIAADVAARGLSDHILLGVELIDYDRFVALCTEHHPIQSWY
jgi:sulfur relay protein TusB/DsrH